MIKKMIKLFRKEKEKEPPTEFKLKELKEYIDEKKSDAKKNLKKKIDFYKEEIKKGSEKIDSAIVKLEKGKLRNPNVTTKEIQFMEGNRKAYVKKVFEVKNNLEFPEKIEEIVEFCINMNDKIDDFFSSTQKSYQVLQEFFSHESGEIAHYIRGLLKYSNDLKKLIENSDLENIKIIMEKISNTENLIQNEKELAKEILEKQNEVSKKKIQLSEIQEQTDEIIQSDDYEDLKEKKKRIININNSIKSKESELINHFSVLEKAMKKFEKMAMDNVEVILNYLKNPFKSIIDDNKLEIIEVLNKLEKSIQLGSVSLNEKKKEKSLKKISMLDQNFLSGFQKEIIKLYDESKKISDEIANNKTNNRYLQLIENKDNIENEIKRLKERISQIKEENNSSQIKENKKEIEDLVEEYFGKGVIIL